jgi:hypothetical protein
MQLQRHVEKTGSYSMAGAVGRECVPAATAVAKGPWLSQGSTYAGTRVAAAPGQYSHKGSAAPSTTAIAAAAKGGQGGGGGSPLRGVRPPQLSLEPPGVIAGNSSSGNRYKGTGETVFRSHLKSPPVAKKEVRGQSGGAIGVTRAGGGTAASADELGFGSKLSPVLDMEDLKRDLEQSLKGCKQQMKRP